MFGTTAAFNADAQPKVNARRRHEVAAVLPSGLGGARVKKKPPEAALMWSRDCGATLFDESRRRRDVGSTALRAVTLTAGERACGEPVKDLKKSSDARHRGSRFAADPAPACAKRWRGACAVLWARPADSVSAGNAGDQSKLRSRGTTRAKR